MERLGGGEGRESGNESWLTKNCTLRMDFMIQKTYIFNFFGGKSWFEVWKGQIKMAICYRFQRLWSKE